MSHLPKKTWRPSAGFLGRYLLRSSDSTTTNSFAIPQNKAAFSQSKVMEEVSLSEFKWPRVRKMINLGRCRESSRIFERVRAGAKFPQIRYQRFPHLAPPEKKKRRSRKLCGRATIAILGDLSQVADDPTAVPFLATTGVW